MSAVKTSAVTLAILFGLLAVPASSFAYGDAGITAITTADAGAVAASVQPVTAEPAVEVVAPEAAASIEKQAAASTEKQAGAADQTSLDRFSNEIMNILVPAFVTLIGGLAALLLAWVRKKLKLDVSNQQIHQWSEVARMAAARGGEWARNQGKTLTEGKTIPGPDILEVAVNWGLEYGQAHGLVDVGREKLEGLIEGELQKRRIALELANG